MSVNGMPQDVNKSLKVLARNVGIPLELIAKDLSDIAISEGSRVYVSHDGQGIFMFAIFIPNGKTEINNWRLS